MGNKESLSKWKSCSTLRERGLVVKYPEYELAF